MQEARGELMEEMQQLQAQVEQQAGELRQYADNDPEALARLTEAAEVRATTPIPLLRQQQPLAVNLQGSRVGVRALNAHPLTPRIAALLMRPSPDACL